MQRCLCVLLAYTMLITPCGLESIAYAASQYSQIATTNWSSGNRTIEYQYDDNGSCTQKVTKETSTSTTLEKIEYEYNLQNRLSKQTTKDGSDTVLSWTKFTYNDEGIRVQAVSYDMPRGGGTHTNQTTTNYLIDTYNHTGYAQVLEEKDIAGSVVKTYTIGDDVLSQSNSSGDTGYLLYDGHGSTRQLVNNSGVVSDCFSYDVYGVMLGGNPTRSNPAVTSMLYAGEQWDTSAQMYYLRARYYDPLNGRFNQTDTFAGSLQDPQSLHKYLYCHANPVNAIDPTGRMTLVETVVSITNLLVIRAMELAPTIAAYTWAATKIAGITFLATSAYIGLTELGWAPDSRVIKTLQTVSGVVFLAAFIATGMLNAVPRVQGKVPYGSTHLSKQSQAARINEHFKGGRNVTVFEYKDDSGSLRTIVATSSRGIPGGGHAERIAGRALETMNVSPSQVTQIYSELEPCDNRGAHCARYISETFPQASVSWSFDYADPAARAQGKAEWLDAIDRLFNGRLF